MCEYTRTHADRDDETLSVAVHSNPDAGCWTTTVHGKVRHKTHSLGSELLSVRPLALRTLPREARTLRRVQASQLVAPTRESHRLGRSLALQRTLALLHSAAEHVSANMGSAGRSYITSPTPSRSASCRFKRSPEMPCNEVRHRFTTEHKDKPHTKADSRTESPQKVQPPAGGLCFSPYITMDLAECGETTYTQKNCTQGKDNLAKTQGPRRTRGGQSPSQSHNPLVTVRLIYIKQTICHPW